MVKRTKLNSKKGVMWDTLVSRECSGLWEIRNGVLGNQLNFVFVFFYILKPCNQVGDQEQRTRERIEDEKERSRQYWWVDIFFIRRFK